MIREYRTVEEIASPLMIVRMVDGVTYDELVEVELHDGSVRRGQVLEVNGDTAVVQLFESAAGINLADAKVRFLGHPLQICWAGCSTAWAGPSTAGRRSWRRSTGTSTACP